MVMVGRDGRMSEDVVAICRLIWREFVVSRDVVGDARLRVSSSSKIVVMVPGDGIARRSA